jgi:AcrR family transcriptional regulator
MPTETFLKLNPEKREKIVACAIGNFAKNGYTGTSMESVAECAGIAKGALYRYFTGKKDLYMFIVSHLVDDVDLYAKEFLAQRKGQNVFQTIRDWMVAIYDFQERFSTHQKVLCNILYQEDLDFKGEVLAKFGKLSTHYTRLLLQQGIARGEVYEEIDLEAAGFIIESVIDRFHDGISMPYLDHGFGLYQQPQEVINRKSDLVIEAFRRAFGKRPAGINDFPDGSE